MSDESGSALDPDKIPRRRGLHIRDIKEEAPEPAQTVGSELKAAREAAGKTLNEVAATLRIKPEHLIALEAAEYGRLPAKTYVVGFVRQYAQHVGLNAAEMVERLKVELDGPPPEAPARKAEPARRMAGPVKGPVKGLVTPGSRLGQADEDSSRLPTLSIAVVVILLLLVMFGGWYLTRSSDDGDSSVDKKTETSDIPPRVRSGEEADGGLPRPRLLPASGGEVDEAGRGSGSLTALLPGADRIGSGTETIPAGDAPAPSAAPDAAALAVPIENSRAAGREAAAGAESPGRPRGEAVVAEAMPQPNMQVKTVPSHLPGLPEGEGGAEGAEPALTEIEAEGVGGEGEAGDAPASVVQPRPKLLATAARGAGEYGASAVRSRVTLRVRSSTWVRVEDADGRIIIERDMRSGDSFRAPDVDGLYLVTKDAGAIELYLDGQSIGRAGRPKQVLTGLQLAPEKLRQHVAQNTGPEIR